MNDEDRIFSVYYEASKAWKNLEHAKELCYIYLSNNDADDLSPKIHNIQIELDKLMQEISKRMEEP